MKHLCNIGFGTSASERRMRPTTRRVPLLIVLFIAIL